MTSFINEEEHFGYGSPYKEEQELEQNATSEYIPAEVPPKIHLMGTKRSGKSSILNVVFHKMSPNETLFLESTSYVRKESISNSSLVQFTILDFPDQIDFYDPNLNLESIFGGLAALVFVIDSQDDYTDALTTLISTANKAYAINPTLKMEVFIHKVEAYSDDQKIKVQRDIYRRLTEDMATDNLGSFDNKIRFSCYLTTIYDHSIFEAFSKVVQKLIPQLGSLENLLNVFVSNSLIEKAFLFDMASKIYIATDSAPVDIHCYELCSDMIDVVSDISCIYGLSQETNTASFDNDSSSVIKLTNKNVLFLKEVHNVLALVCVVREDNFENTGVIEYNFIQLREAIHKIFKVRRDILMFQHSKKNAVDHHLSTEIA